MSARIVIIAWMLIAIARVNGAGDENRVAVSSLAELAEAAGKSGQVVTMKPGVYRLVDYLAPNMIAEQRKRGEFQFLTFAGHDNVFHLGGATIEVDTALRNALRPPIHTDEILVSGNNNTLAGLTIRHIGEGASSGGAALGVTGQGNTLRDCTLHVCGSFPYGYGDLFGKGGSDIIGPRKKSGVHITGDGTRLVGCKLFMRSFGHGYYIQEDAENVSFEDCSVEGVMRATDDILAETTGPAFKVDFRTVVTNRAGENRVTPGYMKSLSEDGFRTYGQHKNLSFTNCTAKNMRGGFELRSKAGARLENCAALGNERGFWISTDAIVQNCRGDAQYGPLLFVEGDNAVVDVELLPSESTATVHALATIQGQGSKITIRQSPTGARNRAIPILMGYGTPMMGDGMASIPEREARRISLRNETSMPILIGPKARDSEILTAGPVEENRGKDVVVKRLENSVCQHAHIRKPL
jgi:hypothetical protein